MEVEVDEHDALAGAGERDRKIGDRGRLPLTFDRARNKQRASVAIESKFGFSLAYFVR